MFTSTAFDFIVAPILLGFKCLTYICAPTVVWVLSNSGATAFIAEFSIKATKAGVANTGKSPDPIVRAVTS